MKNTLIRVLALLVMVMLMLTGCSKEAPDSTKVIEFADGTAITKGDMKMVYNDMYSYYSYLYQMYYNVVPADLDEYTAQQTADAYLAQELTKRHAGDYGIELTAEMEAEAAENAQAEWESYLTSYINANLTEENAKDPEKARKMAERGVERLGYNYDYMLKEHTDSVLVNAIIEAMTADITTVDETELQAQYEKNVASDEAAFAGNVAAYEEAVSFGETAYWIPEGYRGVQHILLKPEDTALLTEYEECDASVAALSDELLSAIGGNAAEGRTTDVITDELNTATAALRDVEARIIAACQTQIDEINTKLAEGIAFPELINDYTADSDALIYVGAETTSLITPFKNGAMALVNEGDISAPIVGQYGVHLIYYAEEVASGAVDFESVRDVLEAELLQAAKDAAYDAQVQAWIEESGAQIYIERWIPAE